MTIRILGDGTTRVRFDDDPPFAVRRVLIQAQAPDRPVFWL